MRKLAGLVDGIEVSCSGGAVSVFSWIRKCWIIDDGIILAHDLVFGTNAGAATDAGDCTTSAPSGDSGQHTATDPDEPLERLLCDSTRSQRTRDSDDDWIKTISQDHPCRLEQS